MIAIHGDRKMPKDMCGNEDWHKGVVCVGRETIKIRGSSNEAMSLTTFGVELMETRIH